MLSKTGSLQQMLAPRCTKKGKRRGNHWRDKLSARSMSIIDDDDDDDDDDSMVSSESNLLHDCAAAEKS